MRLFVSSGNRYRAIEIDPTKTTSDLASEIVKAGLQKGIYAFSLYYHSLPLKEGTLKSEGLTENCFVIARPTLSSSIDLQIRTPDNQIYVTEAFPIETIGSIKERFIQKSGFNADTNFFVMNAKLLNTPEDKLQDHILRESDVIFVVPMPEKVPPAHTFIYCSLGNDLLMQLTVKDESSVSDLKNLIESRYKIPSENQLIYWHGSPVDDSRTIDTFAPDDTFVLLSLELTGKLNVIFENGGKKIKKKFSAYSTVGEIKTVLFQSYNDANKNNNAKEEDNENDDNSNSQQKIIHDNKSLAFEGMMCDDNDALFSFCRLEPRFTLNGVEDQISIDKVNNMIRAKAEANDYCYLYIYAKMLFFGIVIPQDKVLAAQYFEKAYEQGHYTAMTDYAELIYNGELPEPRPDAAMKYSKRAADNGHIGATYLYGILCLKQRKFAEAQQYLNKATNQGHILAATAYAQMILKGQSEVTDKTVAQDLLVNAAKKKYPPAMKALAKLMKFEGNIEGADKLMQEAASLGSPGALYYLANQVLIKNDFKKAAKYAQEASKYGHTGAKRLLGIMQRRGTGVDKNIEEAFKLLTEASEKGDTQATFHLAKMYLRGDGCEVDKEKAYELVSKAASDGHKSSILFKCNLMLRGIGCEKDPEGAYKFASKCAKKTGNVQCIRFIGVCQRFGIGCKQDVEEAARNLIRAAESDKIGMFHYAMLLKGLPRYPSNKNEVIHFLKMSADRDFHEAEEQLGLLLLEKEGINEDQYEINKKEAMKYFKKAAKAGRIESMLQLALLLLEYGGKDETAAKYIERTAKEKHPLGLYYFSLILEEGRGIEKDMKNSRKYLQMSADLNVPIAQHRLGVKLCEENKVPEGISYLRKACEANLVDAMMDLVRVLKQDDPVTYEEEIQSWLIKAAELGCCEAAVMAALYLVTKKKYYDAFNFFKMAALKGHIEGMFNYGKMLEEGLGTPIDRKEAVKYYRLSVDGGSIPAMFYLGRCYENGTGVEQSYINAAKLYRLSAENGDPEGMVGIGKLYKEGFGVDQNYEYALQYFQKAVGLGHVIGNYEFAKMYEFGLGTDEDKKVAYDHFKFASDRGHGPAMVFHAHDLLHGIAVEKDVEAGREVLMKAIALNEKDAMFEYAELLDFEGQSSEAFKYYRMSADLGHVQGMNCTAYILSQDEDKLEEAAKYLEKAADKDDMIAACNFGIALAQGKGIIRDQKRAVTYLRRAADSGIVEAMYNCGVLLITAKGDVRNEAEAKNMLKLASKNGHVKATFDLAMLIMTTEPNNIKETLDLLKTAADKGCVEANPLFAYYTLNNISKSAKGNDEINQENEETKKSLELAAKYAKKGAELGNTQSMVIYGSILLNGAGMNKSESDAVEYFKKAAEKGDVNGMFNYGSVLIRGVGVSQDQENGTKFLLEAMKNGHEYAQSLLDQFNIKY